MYNFKEFMECNSYINKNISNILITTSLSATVGMLEGMMYSLALKFLVPTYTLRCVISIY